MAEERIAPLQDKIVALQYVGSDADIEEAESDYKIAIEVIMVEAFNNNWVIGGVESLSEDDDDDEFTFMRVDLSTGREIAGPE